MNNVQELTTLAYREAGYAVTAWKHGVKIRSVTVIPNHDSLSEVLTPRLNSEVFQALESENPTPTQRDRIERQVIVLLAGRIALERFTGQSSTEGVGEERVHITDLIIALCGSAEEADAYVQWLNIRAKGCVNTLWACIERVAAELTRLKVLTGENVSLIIQREIRA